MRKAAMAILMAVYLLGIHKGYVAIWHNEDPEPMIVTEMPADLLPEEDAAKLAAGIRLPEDASLSKVLEDYCS